MNEALRHEIMQRRQAGASIRVIARALGISRGAVGRVLAQVQTQRDGPSAPLPRPRRRGSLLDEYESILQELLTRYPNLTVERALQSHCVMRSAPVWTARPPSAAWHGSKSSSNLPFRSSSTS